MAWQKGTWIAFGGVFAFWVYSFFSFDPPHRTPAKGDGSYTPILARGDGHYMYMTTLSLVFDRDLDLRNQYAAFGDPFHQRVVPETQRVWIYPVGASVLQLPAFLVAHAAAHVRRLLGDDVTLHGYTYWHQSITFFSSLLAGFLALVLGYNLARRYVSRAAALWGVVVVGLGSGLFFWSTFWASHAHSWSALGVALLCEYWDRTRGRHDARRWAALGALAGLAALARLQEILFAAIPAAELLAEAARRARARDGRGVLRVAGYGALAALTATVVVSPQIIANRVVYGHFFAVHAGESYMRWSAPFLWEPLFSTRNGLFVWTPLCWLGAIGLLGAPRGRARLVAAALAVGFFLQMWVNGSAWAWWGDFSFSHRRFMDTSVVFVVGTAFLVERLRDLHSRYPRLMRHGALAVVLAPLLIMNLELSRKVARFQARPVPGQPTESETIYLESIRRSFLALKDEIGNPFSAPASWIWALRHRIHPKRYDRITSEALLYFGQGPQGRLPRRHVETLRPDEATLAKFGDGSWDGPRPRSGARLLLPLFVWEHVHVVLRAQAVEGGPADAILAINGKMRHSFDLGLEPRDVRIDIPRGILHPGTNELVFQCVAPQPGAPCLNLERLDLVFDEGSRY